MSALMISGLYFLLLKKLTAKIQNIKLSTKHLF
ncbi:MAG: hypothetical protein BWY27_01629 [Bacteroidetes bacterium ADurb.Bin234]|nr:MAG: hypothetical protein BWY27_01629 [Bacteroidetes bacterium ADurb.Bin234]